VAGERRKDGNWKTVGASGEEKGDLRKRMRIGNRCINERNHWPMERNRKMLEIAPKQ
jgi:hypothetical protein